ncbi:MAG: hypothetical protein E7321_01520 [Clostridiales bacterium]|nr:hypothetical protein [Clostridiales bacterium]
MKKMTQTQVNALNKTSKNYMMLKKNYSIQEILSTMYQEAFPYCDTETANSMAYRALNGVKLFEKNLDEARSDRDLYLKKFQNRMDEGKSAAEKFEYWKQFAIAVLDMQNKEGENAKTTLYKEISEMTITKENEEVRAIWMRNLAYKIVKDNRMMLTGLENQAEALEQMETGSDAAWLLQQVNGNEMEYRALMAMQMYILKEKGEIEGVPVSMTIEETAVLTCANDERIKILANAHRDEVIEESVYCALKILSCVVLCVIGIEFWTFVLNAFSGNLFLEICWCVATLGMLTVFADMFNSCKEASAELAKDSVQNLHKAAAGARRMAKYIERFVFPQALKKQKAMEKQLDKDLNRMYNMTTNKLRRQVFA